MPDFRGAAYDPTPSPRTGDAAADRIGMWVQTELGRVSSALRYGRAQFLSMDELAAAPAKPVEGMIGFFLAGVVGAGAGTYEYRGGAWQKL